MSHFGRRAYRCSQCSGRAQLWEALLIVSMLITTELLIRTDAFASSGDTETDLQDFYGLSHAGVSVTQSGPAQRSAFIAGDQEVIEPETSAACDEIFSATMEELISDLQTNFTQDATLNYLNLILPLQLATASLCRQLLIHGFDLGLLQICFTQVPTLDGESANLLLELESRGYTPAEFACSDTQTQRCEPVDIGCGACEENTTQLFLASLAPLPDHNLCSPADPRNINSDFACIFSTVLMAQSNLSREYLALNLPSSSVNFIASDIVELYSDNAIHGWIASQELICPWTL